ncbi:MAG: nitrogenase, partial [Eubacteriales bacterium]|nr:nitrogenase [Eubacteriales bacterium]
MLRRVQTGKNRTEVDGTGARVRIADAAFPVPFAHSLEFNAPVHGTWNIVHIGMLVPECHQIYVCADNCMRGVVLTAAEMDASDRFS